MSRCLLLLLVALLAFHATAINTRFHENLIHNFLSTDEIEGSLTSFLETSSEKQSVQEQLLPSPWLPPNGKTLTSQDKFESPEYLPEEKPAPRDFSFRKRDAKDRPVDSNRLARLAKCAEGQALQPREKRLADKPTWGVIHDLNVIQNELRRKQGLINELLEKVDRARYRNGYLKESLKENKKQEKAILAAIKDAGKNLGSFDVEKFLKKEGIKIDLNDDDGDSSDDAFDATNVPRTPSTTKYDPETKEVLKSSLTSGPLVDYPEVRAAGLIVAPIVSKSPNVNADGESVQKEIKKTFKKVDKVKKSAKSKPADDDDGDDSSSDNDEDDQ